MDDTTFQEIKQVIADGLRDAREVTLDAENVVELIGVMAQLVTAATRSGEHLTETLQASEAA